MAERLDVAVVGSGPAGLSAALNLNIRKKSFQVFGSLEFSSKLTKAHEVNNYLGFPKISGRDLAQKMREHLQEMDIQITEEKIQSIYNMGDYFALVGTKGQYEAKTVILATGMYAANTLTGETEFLGRGVGYCATCDAGLFRDKIVTIVAYNKHEEAEANFLADIASKVYYLPLYKEEVEVAESVEIISGKPLSIVGDMKVRKLVLDTGEIETDGLFILRDSIPPTQLLQGLDMDGNHIKVTRDMATSMAGVFAVGDLVGLPYQYIKGAGEGNIAALSAVSYLSQLEKEKK